MRGRETVQHHINWKTQKAMKRKKWGWREEASVSARGRRRESTHSHLVKPAVLSSLEDAEEQEATQSKRPDNDKDACNEVPRLERCCRSSKEGEEGEDKEIGGSSEISELVRLEAEADEEEGSLYEK